jgi:hypothetical protein
MPIFREACEGRVRCLIKNPTQNQDEPQNLAMQLLQKSNPANQGNLLKGIDNKTVRRYFLSDFIAILNHFVSLYKLCVTEKRKYINRECNLEILYLLIVTKMQPCQSR